MTAKTPDGHPGLWGPGMELETVRKAYDAMLAAGPRQQAQERAKDGKR